MQKEILQKKGSIQSSNNLKSQAIQKQKHELGLVGVIACSADNTNYSGYLCNKLGKSSLV